MKKGEKAAENTTAATVREGRAGEEEEKSRRPAGEGDLAAIVGAICA